jgi:serine/threonine protein phosphatase 1
MKGLFAFLRKGTTEAPRPPTLFDDARLYVIGDIHGRLDCLDDLLDRIEKDRTGFRGPVEYIFLGDLVDRGPQSKGVIQRLLELSQGSTPTRFLLGNHEEVMIMSINGDRSAMRMFDRIGGRDTALSYGIDPDIYDSLPADGQIEALANAVPAEHLDFLSGFEDLIAVGDYRFVHAGIRPGVALNNQVRSDMRWIRGTFLNHELPFDGMIVHGHTVTEEIDQRSNRIGIDTGAYKTGRLTCLVLEGSTQRFLQTALAPDLRFQREAA